MMEYNEKNARRWSVLGERPMLGLTLLEKAKEDDTILAVVADVVGSAGLERMRNTLPEQIINVGIAEQNMMTIAAGLASEGYKVVTSSFAPFQSMRCLEQIRVNLGYMKQKVVMVGLASGVAYGELGHTHCCIEDVAILKSIPNIAVVTPADCMEVAKVVEAALEYDTSVYIRLLDKTNVPIVYSQDYDFKIGLAVPIIEEGEIAIIANGTMVYPSAMAAREYMESSGKKVAVYNMHTVKPLDEELLEHLRSKVKAIITVEEHSVIGGLGTSIGDYYAQYTNHPMIKKMGIKDEYCHGASHETILNEYNLTKESIIKEISNIMEV